jgi:broad specificity phosphatase PhoE
MPATRIHLVRHGEVNNPDGVLYGRLPNFPLSDLGQQMAAMAASELKESGAKITRLIASPLLRTMQSAEPFASGFNLPIEPEDRIIEPSNVFEGHSVNLKTLVRNPRFFLKLYNPFRPSWGEAFIQIQRRMIEAMQSAWDSTPSGEIVMVSHQLPIWMVHRHVSGRPLAHDHRSRRCALSSITSFEFKEGRFVEVAYLDPAKALRLKSVDRGAV